MNEGEVEPALRQADKGTTDWTLCGILMSAALLAALAVLPYLVEILRATGEQVVVSEFALSTVTEHMLLVGIAICIGMVLGPKVDLGAPLLDDLRSGTSSGAKQGSALLAALIGGFGVGVALFLATPWLEGLMPPWPESARQAEKVAENIPSWKPLLASFSAGVTEELLFRYGLMTLLVWLGAKMTRQKGPLVSTIWMANLLAALLFSLAHLTNVVELGIKVTAGTVLYVVISNGIASVVFGWLYWRRGLEAAILAHCSADVVVKVIAPLLRAGLE